MPFIQEKNLEINIGLKKEYKLIQFSDVHMVTYRETDSIDVINEAKRCEKVWDEQKVWFAKGASENCDSSHMIPSVACLTNLIDYANSEKPESVVLAGDILDYYSESNYEVFKEMIKKIEYPFVFVCGNHETPAKRYSEIIGNEIGYSSIEFDEFILIGIDNSTKKVSLDTLNKIKEELKKEKPIIISMHVPISTSKNSKEMSKFDPYFIINENDTDEITKEFISLSINNKNIKALLCGHVHGFNVSEFANDKMQFCSSSGLIGMVNKIIIK